MDATRPPTQKAVVAVEHSAAAIAKAVFRRLATERLEPTPENYGRIYREESGAVGATVMPSRAERLIDKLSTRVFENDARAAGSFREAVSQGRWEQADRALESMQSAPPTNALAELIDRIIRGLEKGGQNWTVARRREGIQRVLQGSRGDVRVMQRLGQLMTSWDNDFASSALAPLTNEPEPVKAAKGNPLERLSLQIDADKSARADASAAEATRVIAAAAKLDELPPMVASDRP